MPPTDGRTEYPNLFLPRPIREVKINKALRKIQIDENEYKNKIKFKQK